MIAVHSRTDVKRVAGDVFAFVNDQANAQLWLSGLLETRPTSESHGVGYTWVDVMEVFGRRVDAATAVGREPG